MRCRVLSIFLCVILMPDIGLHAQNSRTFGFQHFGKEQGLSGSSVYAIEQDSRNFIWFGTENGLTRFDGSNFKTYGPEEGVYSRIISDLEVLNDSTLLAVGDQPNRLYYIHNDHSISNTYPGLDIASAKQDVHPITRELFFWDYTSVYKLRKDGRVDTLAKLSRGESFDGLFAPDGRLILSRKRSSKASATLMQFHNGQLTELDIHNFGDEQIFGLFNDHSGEVLFHCTSGIYDLEGNLKYQPKGLPDNHKALSKYYALDTLDRIWFADEKTGVYYFDMRSEELADLLLPLVMKDKQVTNIFADRNGNIWVGTEGDGIFFIPISPIIRSYSTLDGLSSNYINQIGIADDHYYIGTNIGLNIVDGDSIAPLRYRNIRGEEVLDQGYVVVFQQFQGYSICFNPVLSFEKDTLMLKSGVCNVSIPGGIGISLPLDSNHILVPRWDHVQLRNVKSGYIEHKLKKKILGKIKKVFAFCRFQDQLWIGSTDGLFTLDTGLTAIDKFDLSNALKANQQFPWITYDLQPDGDILWVGTNRGLLAMQQDNWKSIPIGNDSTGIHCKSLCMDKDNRLWIATDKGLAMYDGKSLRSFGHEIGLPSLDIRVVEYFPLKNELIVGTTAGYSVLNLSEIHKYYPKEPELYVDFLEVLNDTVFYLPSSISLPHKSYDLRFSFSALEYQNPQQLQFEHRLLGAHENWIATSDRVANYYGLQPGDYTFEVRGRLGANLWGPVKQVTLFIAKPLWQQIWFVASALATFTLILVLIGMIWTNRIKASELKKREELQRTNLLEQRALNATMNPHFIFNSLNSIQDFLSGHPDPDPNAIDYIANFSTLIRDNMEAAQHKVVSLESEIQSLRLYLELEKWRLESKLNFNIDIDPTLDLTGIFIPSMILIPLAENSIWHGIIPSSRAGIIDIRLTERDEDMLRITITDNGVGLKASRKNKDGNHVSRGLEITRERLLLQSSKNSIHLENRVDSHGNNLGTRAEINLDISP